MFRSPSPRSRPGPVGIVSSRKGNSSDSLGCPEAEFGTEIREEKKSSTFSDSGCSDKSQVKSRRGREDKDNKNKDVTPVTAPRAFVMSPGWEGQRWDFPGGEVNPGLPEDWARGSTGAGLGGVGAAPPS